MFYRLASHHFVTRCTPYLYMLLGIIPSASSQHPILPGTPIQGLHCALVTLEMVCFPIFEVPNNCASITRARSENSLELILPLERAHLALMVVVFLYHILENSQVVHQDRSVLGATHQKIIHKGKGRYPISMIPQCSHQAVLINIIYFNDSVRQSNS